MEMKLQLPNSYVEVTDDEMMYVEGGGWWDYSKPWNHVTNMAFTLDTIIWAGSAALGIGGAMGAVREILRKNAKGLIVNSTKTLLRSARIAIAGAAVNSIVNGLSHFLDFSFGKAIAYSWDRYVDKNRNNGICDWI